MPQPHLLPFQQNRIFTLNEPNAPRLNPALACEIGLNESVILLQLEFWIAISNNERDGMYWTYQSVRDIQSTFSFWSLDTINRAIKSLEKKGFIITTTKYNTLKYDKTRWFTLNFSELAKLESISIKGYHTRSTQNRTGSTQDHTGLMQDHTAPPSYPIDITRDSRPSARETTAEITLKTTTTAPVSPSCTSPATTSPPSAVFSNESLKELTDLVIDQHKSEIVNKLIEKELKKHSAEYIKSAVSYANANSKKNYKAFLGQTISNGWAEGYTTPESVTINNDEDEKYRIFLESRRQMPNSYLKMEADNGCKASAQVLKERAERAAINKDEIKPIKQAPASIPPVIPTPVVASRQPKKALTQLSFAGLLPSISGHDNRPQPRA
jgi:hypothetical protein